MKTLFKVLVITIFMSVFMINAYAQLPQMDILRGAPIRVSDKWESTINPVEAYRDWPTLSAYPVSETEILAVTGNPKIDWPKIPVYDFETMLDLCKQIAVPAKETAAAVIFLFVVHKKICYLVEYMYLDDLGVVYTFKLDRGSNTYKHVIDTEQNVL